MDTVKRKSQPLTDLSDQLIFAIAQEYLTNRLGAVEVSRLLEIHYPYEYEHYNLTNEAIRKVLRIAIDHGILRMMPCNEQKNAALIRERCRTALAAANPGVDHNDKIIEKSVRVLDVGGGLVRPHIDEYELVESASKELSHGDREFPTAPMVEKIADAAAEELLALIRIVGRRGKRVHIGLGAGNTAQCVIRRLGELIEGTRDCPPLRLHALTPGFSTDPLKSPVTSFRFFEKSGVDIDYVGLSAAPIVDVADLHKLQQEPGYRNVAAQAKDIDIVVTSLARAGDPHGMLERYLKEHYRDTYDQLQQRAWKGDVQFCPFSNEPLELEQGVRAVSLLGLKDLKAMVHTPDKYVLLVAGPCNACGELKTDAIAPLLVEPALNVWTHLVMDIETAESLTNKPSASGEEPADDASPPDQPVIASPPQQTPPQQTPPQQTPPQQTPPQQTPPQQTPPQQTPPPKRKRSGGGRKKGRPR